MTATGRTAGARPLPRQPHLPSLLEPSNADTLSGLGGARAARFAPFRAHVSRLAALVVLLCSGFAAAQQCTYELEPNDQLDSATVVTGAGPESLAPASRSEVGTSCLSGTLAAGDADVYLWRPSDTEAGHRWAIDLEGEGGQSLNVTLAVASGGSDSDNSDIGGTVDLLTATSDDGSRATSTEFLVNGDTTYLLRFTGGQGTYAAGIRPVSALRYGVESERFEEYSSGRVIAAPFTGHAFVEGELTQDFTVPSEMAGFQWAAELWVALGSSAEFSIMGPGGRVAAGAVGEDGFAQAADLALTPGEYSFTITSTGSGPVTARYQLEAAGRLLDGAAVEPNDEWDQAGLLRPGDSVTGTLARSDYYRLQLDADQATLAWDVSLDSEEEVSLGIRDRWGRVLREARVGQALGQTLEPGAYQVIVEGPTDAQYSLVISPATAAADDLEPNDAMLAATSLEPSGSLTGEFTGRDTDFFRLEISGAAELYGLRLDSSGSEWLRLLDAEGVTVAETRATTRTDGSISTLRLDDLLLMPGVHYVTVRGSDAQYDLLAAPIGHVPPAGILEIEPNDDVSRAIRLQQGATHVGRLTGDSDDYFRFHLADDQFVRVEVRPPADSGGIRALLDGNWNEPFDEQLGSLTVVEEYLLAGDHSLMLRVPQEPSGGYYQLVMTPLGVLLPPVDAEPNDTREQAALLPAELTLSGRVGQRSSDYDIFRLPRFTSPTFVTVSASGTTGNFGIDFPSDSSITVSERGNTEQGSPWVAELPADTEVWLRVSGRTAYELNLSFSNEPDPAQLLPPRADDMLSVALTAPVDAIAAFWHEGQTVELTAAVHNAGPSAQSVELQVASSHATVGLSGATRVEVAPGQTVEVPVTAVVPSDMRDDLPLTVEVSATSTFASTASAATLAAYCEAPPVGAGTYWPLPPSLLGRPNVLWSGFGVTPPEGSGFVNRDLALIDGRTGPATAGYLGPDNRPTYRLAGDEPVTLLATILNPQVGTDVESQVRRFRIETSLDGATFTTALEGSLKAARVEQVFEFDAPITARYARLSIVDNHDGRDNGYVGEWKLIAAEFPLTSVNLADPAVGGHVAWSVPFVSAHGVSLLTPGDSPRTTDIRDFGSLEFVVGFHNNRAGQIERLAWLDAVGTAARGEQEQLADVVKVAVSMAGAAGPWLPLPDWTLERDAEGRSELVLAEPTWARYVRFTVEPDEGVRFIYLPDTVNVYERAVSADYPSMLGEYGNASRAASYEYLNPPTASVAKANTDAGDTRQQALPLASGGTVDGAVTVAEDVDWYRLTIPAGENHLAVRLAGDPQIGFRYELQDAAGTRLGAEERSDGEGVLLTYFGEPGEYYLLIEEPKRTVVFNWDTSGSVGPYLPITYNSLARFAADVSGEREAVQLLAFNDPDPKWLLPFWSSDTLRVQRAIVEFDRQADSSNSETSLLVATQALADREGTRAILLMTDAESGSENITPELWQAFGEVMPRIFSFEISTSGSDYSQDLMQDWADVNGGVYTLATGVGDFDAGFARASCILRRAKGYRVEVTSSYVEPPGPGTLTVTRAPGAAQPAVEVIFDASGSMGRELPSGEQRITAAKRALQSLVNEVLPDGTQFALRAFGHIAPSSCETRLDVALAPLDRAKAVAAVAAIEPKLLSQTPLAASLAAVAADMANATAGRTIILITDGVESCQGDPAAAVAGLRAAGIEFDLAIVSLALEPDALASFQTLADSVGASYVDVTSFEELKATIDEALNPAFEVVDAGGAVVARGRVGGAGVELPMGTYTVRVLGAGVEEHTGVRVPGDTLVTLSVGGTE